MVFREGSNQKRVAHGKKPSQADVPGAWSLRKPDALPITGKGDIGVSSMHALSHIQGVYPVSADPALPRPFVGIVGALHGNEPCGLAVVRALRDPEHPIRRRLRHGTLVLIHGNPAATALGERHTPEGTDLNRLFDYAFVHAVPRHAWNPEHYRAVALRPVIENLDAVLDLHSATATTDPFAIVGVSHLDLAARLGCRYVTYGWDRPGLLDQCALMSHVSQRYVPAVSVECGRHHDPASVDTAFAVTQRFLELLGLLPPVTVHRESTRSLSIEVTQRVAKPTADFRFVRPFAGFEPVRAGEKLGAGGGVELVASDDGVILLPNDGVAVGEDLLYLGRAHGAFAGTLSPGSWLERDVA